MVKKKLLLISIITILFIAVFHYLALKHSWYWTYRWLDIPAHILGGFWVSLTALLVSLKIRHIDSINEYKKKAVLVMLLSVAIVAICWEVYELLFKITSLHNLGYWRDSLSDIFNSLIGGLIAFLYFTKNKKTKCNLSEINIRHNFLITL